MLTGNSVAMFLSNGRFSSFEKRSPLLGESLEQGFKLRIKFSVDGFKPLEVLLEGESVVATTGHTDAAQHQEHRA